MPDVLQTEGSLSLERIEITPVAALVGDIVQDRRTGYLTIIQPPLRRVLYWSQGELVLITSAASEDSLSEFLVRRGVIGTSSAFQMLTDDPTDVVAKFHESGLLDLSSRQALLRDWITSLFVPLFGLDEGTAIFTLDEAIEPEKRVFLTSTAALVLEGVRAITNGLVLRRSLGDLKREIEPAHDARHGIDIIPLTETERKIASALDAPTSIEALLKRFQNESVVAAKVVIALMTIGTFEIVESRPATQSMQSADEMQRDLELLAAIGSSDQRSLRAVALSRQLGSFDHYQVLDVPRAATRQQIINAAEQMKTQYNPVSYPPIVRDSVQTILRRVDEAASVLKDNVRRQAYDKLLQQRGGRADDLQRRVTQRSIAQQNYNRARDLAAEGDYYGAIVLLRQAVNFASDMAEAWYLLGTCQERNPMWRRDAAESFQKALSADPNYTDALISLGDLYRAQGMISRAQSCYEDALKIDAENAEARTRLTALKKSSRDR